MPTGDIMLTLTKQWNWGRDKRSELGLGDWLLGGWGVMCLRDENLAPWLSFFPLP